MPSRKGKICANCTMEDLLGYLQSAKSSPRDPLIVFCWWTNTRMDEDLGFAQDFILVSLPAIAAQDSNSRDKSGTGPQLWLWDKCKK